MQAAFLIIIRYSAVFSLIFKVIKHKDMNPSLFLTCVFWHPPPGEMSGNMHHVLHPHTDYKCKSLMCIIENIFHLNATPSAPFCYISFPFCLHYPTPFLGVLYLIRLHLDISSRSLGPFPVCTSFSNMQPSRGEHLDVFLKFTEISPYQIHKELTVQNMD